MCIHININIDIYLLYVNIYIHDNLFKSSPPPAPGGKNSRSTTGDFVNSDRIGTLKEINLVLSSYGSQSIKRCRISHCLASIKIYNKNKGNLPVIVMYKCFFDRKTVRSAIISIRIATNWAQMSAVLRFIDT